jgi:hypothetical protein
MTPLGAELTRSSIARASLRLAERTKSENAHASLGDAPGAAGRAPRSVAVVFGARVRVDDLLALRLALGMGISLRPIEERISEGSNGVDYAAIGPEPSWVPLPIA